MFDFLMRARGKAMPAGPGPQDTLGPEGEMNAPAGDASTHNGVKVWDRAPSRIMRAFGDSDQPPLGPEYADPRHNLYMPTRFAMGWFGGLIPNQPLPDWSLVAQANSARFHAPDSPIQQRAKTAAHGGPGGERERGRGVLFPTAVVNPPQYLRHGGTAPIGIGPMQIQDFHVATDASRPNRGNGPGSTYANVPFMGAGFGAET